MMEAEELLRAGQLDQAQSSLERAIRAAPADAKLRVFFSQLLAVLGQWDRAFTQLNVASELDPVHLLMTRMYGTALRCEVLRGQVFAGARTPLIFGEPQPWVGWLVQAHLLTAQGQDVAAAQLRGQALEAAPALAGAVDDHEFEWIADADSRLGPVLEAIVEGQYYWVPFQVIRAVEVSAPKDLFDLVWIPAQFTWVNHGQSAGLIPVRYPRSEECRDNALRLARKTEWLERQAGTYLGLGQRTLVTEEQEYAILNTRHVRLFPPDRDAGADGGRDG
ncbi:MAG: tetratricopeptide repeat protein [Planctomycetes bacterium]|jgi:type VI secretion system protein ImpE|nr:tetratricopeptide repeat protein [Planctomycetota bacterium]